MTGDLVKRKKDPALLDDDRARLPHVWIIPGGMDVGGHAVRPTPESIVKQKEKVDAVQAKAVELNLRNKNY